MIFYCRTVYPPNLAYGKTHSTSTPTCTATRSIRYCYTKMLPCRNLHIPLLNFKLHMLHSYLYLPYFIDLLHAQLVQVIFVWLVWDQLFLKILIVWWRPVTSQTTNPYFFLVISECAGIRFPYFHPPRRQWTLLNREKEGMANQTNNPMKAKKPASKEGQVKYRNLRGGQAIIMRYAS